MNVKIVKDLSLHGNNLVKILNDTLLGDTEIKPYDATVTYNTGDLILYYSSALHKFELQKCKEDSITGLYDDTKWEDAKSNVDCGLF
jgi:hypothetical protein